MLRHRSAVSGVRCLTGQFPWRHTVARRFRPDRSLVATDFSIEYLALSIGLTARRARLITFGVMARFTVLAGCIARRTPLGTSSLDRNPISLRFHGLAQQVIRPGGPPFHPQVSISVPVGPFM